MMGAIIATTLLIQAYISYVSAIAGTTPVGPILAPGRMDRIMPRAPGRDCGTFTMRCKGAEGACNNACYHTVCELNGVPNSNRVTYVGAGQDQERNRNREESGCTAKNGGSVCRNFPFSQLFINEANRHTIAGIDCDEWPPAMAQQGPFVSGTTRNSLRCIPASENQDAGRQLGLFVQGRGNHPGRNQQCAGQLQRDDYFAVEFDINGADQSKLKFCEPGRGTAVCGQDGYQFYMSSRPTQHGKISSYYDPFGTDNRYRLQNQTPFKDLMQCSIELTRTGDREFKYQLLNWKNDKVKEGKETIMGATGSFEITGLREKLVVEKTGVKGTPVNFKYSEPRNADNINWDSNSVGDGRGPATNDRQPYRYCKVTNNGNDELTNCWFPCYEP